MQYWFKHKRSRSYNTGTDILSIWAWVRLRAISWAIQGLRHSWRGLLYSCMSVSGVSGWASHLYNSVSGLVTQTQNSIVSMAKECLGPQMLRPWTIACFLDLVDLNVYPTYCHFSLVRQKQKLHKLCKTLYWPCWSTWTHSMFTFLLWKNIGQTIIKDHGTWYFDKNIF